MPKIFITKKEAKEKFYVFRSYKHLEFPFDSDYYNSGVYGWNCNLFKFNNYLIVQGYRPFGEILDDYVSNKINEIIREEKIKFFEDNRNCYELELDIKAKIYNLLSNINSTYNKEE